MKTELKDLLMMIVFNYALLYFTNFPRPGTTKTDLFLVFIILVLIAACVKRMLVTIRSGKKKE